MLDGLDRVDWGALSHAYGEASDVPELLRELVSPDEKVRQGALYALYGNIWHQGTVYEATAYAVPFLIELLTPPSLADRAGILGLLQSIAGGSSYLAVHQHFDSYRSERETEEFQEQRALELDWVRAAHEAVVAGTPVYLSLLSDAETSVRAMAAYALASCGERLGEIQPELRRRAGQETEPVAKASVLFALALLGKVQNAEEVLGDLTHVFRSPDEVGFVRFVAALGAVVVGGDALLDETLVVLRETQAFCANLFSDFPWDLGEAPAAAASAMLAAYPHARLGWLMEMLENRDAESRVAAVREIEELCRERRFAAREVVVPLTRLVADPDAAVRQQAANALPMLGQARAGAVPVLTALQHHADGDIRQLAAETLAKVQAVRNPYALEKWLRQPNEARVVSEWIAVLDSEANPSRRGEAATALEFVGPAAIAAVPALRKALGEESHWLRVRAARALWKITRDPAECLPFLQEEIQCRPAGLLVLDCLGAMGRGAASVVPILQRIVDSEVRLVEIGSLTDWIDEDEAFCHAAERALERIRETIE